MGNSDRLEEKLREALGEAMPQRSEPKRVTYHARPHQFDVMQSEKELIFMGGGVGSGKTDVGSLWLLSKVKATPEGVVAIICANSYSQLIDSTMWNVYRNYRKWGVDIRPRTLLKAHRPFNVNIWNGYHWVEVRCRSLDAYNLLSGQEVGWIWADEVFMTKKAAIDVVLARLRDKQMDWEEVKKFNPDPTGEKWARLQMLFTTVLDEPTSWMYKMFVDDFNEEMMDVIYAPTDANRKNLPEGYIKRLKQLYTKQMFERMVGCKWVTLEGDQVYYAFNRKVHISVRADYDPNLPVGWTHDFNIGQGKPMSSALFQVKKGPGPDGEIRPEMHFFDEIVIDSSDTNQAVEEFVSREWVTPDQFKTVEVHGDASGKAKDTRSKTTDYGILANAGFVNQKKPRANPPIRNRHNSVNALLLNAEGDVRMLIHPRCRGIVKGLETVGLKKGAQYLEKETYEQHVTAAVGYGVDRLFPSDIKAAKVVRLGGF